MAELFNYGLYLMSYDEYYLGSILKQYLLDLKKHSRRVTVGFNYNDILKEILLSEEGAINDDASKNEEQEKKDKKSDNDFNYGKYTNSHKYYSVILSSVIDKIEFYLQEGKLDLLDVETAEEFNILDYWSQNPTAGKVTVVGQGGAKGGGKSGGPSSKAASSKGTSRGSKSRVSKRTSGSTQLTRSIRCELGPIVKINLIEKQSSKMADKSNAPKTYIEDQPTGIDLYIIIIGNVGSDIIIDLIARGYPLNAIAYLFPKDQSSPDFENYVQEEKQVLFKSSHTKTVGFYDLHVTPLPCYFTTRFSKQVYDELAWFLYDTELQRSRRDNFLDHIKEKDVSDERICDKVNISRDLDFPEISTYNVTCLLYFERFLNTFNDDTSSLKSHHQSLNWCCETPYIDVSDKFRLLEETNMILRMHLKSELDLSYYYSAMDTFRKMYSLSKVWTKKAYKAPQDSFDGHSNNSMYEFDNNAVPEYAEPLTANAIVQRFEALRHEYDSIYYLFNASERDVIITLTSTRRPFYEKSDKILVPTKVCYRDFTEYVIPEMQEWLRWQDTLKETAEKEAKPKEEPTDPEAIDPDAFTITNTDFIRHVSLKQKKLDGFSEAESNMSFSEQTINSNLEDSDMYDKYKKYFKGYNIDDTRKELHSTRAVYRSRSVTLRVLKDIWINGDQILTLDLIMQTYRILIHRRLPLKTDNPGLRIISTHLWSLEYEHVLGSGETPDDDISLVNIAWPTGMHCECTYKEKTAEIIHIKHYYNNRDRTEEKRLYYADGTMIIFYQNGSAQVWRSNGTLYHSTYATPTESVNKPYDEFSENASEGSTSFADITNKYAFEILYIEKFNDILDADNFTLVTTEGYRYEIKYGRVVASLERYLIAEWHDWVIEENYILREDELLILNRANCTLTYFPNGTFVKTTITDNLLYWYFDQDERQFLPDIPSFATSAENVTNSILDEFVALSSEDLYMTCDRTYLMQHEKFTTCHFMEENTILTSPLGITTKINLDGLIINLKDRIQFVCNKTECNITAPEEEKSLIFGEHFARNVQVGSAVNAKLLYAPQKDEYLFELKELIGHVHIFKDFTWEMQDSHQRSIKRVCEVRLEIGLDGFELQSEQDIYEYVDKIDREDAIIDVTDDVITILTPILTFSEMFNLPIRDLPEFLIKFFGKDFECAKSQKPDKKKRRKCMSIKCFYKLDRFRESVFSSQLNYFVMRTSFASQLSSNFTIADITSKALIEDAGRSALRTHERKVKTLAQQSRLAPFIRLATQYKNKRLCNNQVKTYLTMCTTKVFPKYHDFVAVGENVKKFDTFKLAKLIKLDLPAAVNSTDEFKISPIENKFYKSKSTNIGLHMLIDESSSFQLDDSITDEEVLKEESLIDMSKKEGKTRMNINVAASSSDSSVF